MKASWLFLLVALLAHNVKTARILLVDPMPSHSHFIIPFRLAEELASRGHHVTAITSYPQKTQIKNYVDVPVVENIPLLADLRRQMFNQNSQGIVENLSFLIDTMAVITNETIHHKNVQELLESKQHFDVVIIENFFNEAFVGFGHRFNAPVVLVHAKASSTVNNFIFANPAPLSYIPSIGSSLTRGMDFWKRLENLITDAVFVFFRQWYHLPVQKKIFEGFVKNAAFDDVLFNTSLLLTNSHVSISDAVPHVPSIVEVGGFYITIKPLPEDLQNFLDGAEEGVVLFSMGSNLKSENLKPEVRDGILRAFSKIKEKVLWKFEADLPNLPGNVKIAPWLPQADILNHPNVRAFITHGGRLSTVEAVHFGVPIIGIPVFAEQPLNIANAVNDGYAVKLELKELSEETLTWALDEILRNPKYRENAQHRSRLMHDQPIKPLDAAVFWVEHVIRHQGAPHLRSAGLDLKWYQRELIDVFAFLAAVFGLVFCIIYKLVKLLVNLVFSKSNVNRSRKVKRQ